MIRQEEEYQRIYEAGIYKSLERIVDALDGIESNLDQLNYTLDSINGSFKRRTSLYAVVCT